MESGREVGLGLMAVAAVSGSVALITLHLQKRLVAQFTDKMQFELGDQKRFRPKKKVTFAADVVEPSSNNKEYRKKHSKISPNFN